MDEARGARQALNLDHERRLLALEQWRRDQDRRMSIAEAAIASLGQKVDESLLAKRVADGVAAKLRAADTIGLNRWQKIGIASGALFGFAGFLFTVLQAAGHA